MKKEYYKELKKQNPFLVKKMIHDKLRDKYPLYEDLLLYRTAIAFLCAKYKELQDIERVKNVVDASEETIRGFLLDVLREYQEFIIQLTPKFTLNYFEAVVLFSAEKMLSKNYYSDTPDYISELASRILKLENSDVLLDLGSGMGDFLNSVKLNNPQIKAYGLENNKNLIKIAQIRSLLMNTNLDYREKDFVLEPFKEVKANKVFCNPPLGIRRSDLKNFSAYNKEIDLIAKEKKEPIFADWDYLFSAYENMTHTGKAAVLISAGITSNSTDVEIRKELIRKGTIEKVVLLPKNMLYYIGQETVLLVLSNGNDQIRMVDASMEFETLHRRNYLTDKNVDNIIGFLEKEELPLSRNVDYAEIADNDFIINPQRYLRTGTALKMEAGEKIQTKPRSLSVFMSILESLELKTVELGELCIDITRGAMIKSDELRSLMTDEPTDYAYLELKNINDEEIDFKLPYLKSLKDANEGKWLKYCLKENQIIISKMYPFKIAMVRNLKGRRILATGNLYALDLDLNRVEPWYLVAFLQSNVGLSEIERFATGSAFKMLSISDLKKITL